MKKFIFIPLFLLIVLIAFTSCKKSGNENYVVKFKGGGLTTLDLDAHYTNLKKSRTFKNKPEELTSELVFDHALNMEMIITKGLDEKLHLDPGIRAQIHEFMSDLFLKVMQDRLVPKINKDNFTEEELNKFYNKYKNNYKTKAIYNVKMIKTKTLEPAWEAMKKIKAGQYDFARAAAEYSIDKKSKNRNGDIGSRALSKFRKDWQPVISSLETKKVSGPHKIRDAYYIFKLTNKTEPHQYSFEEKKPYVKNDLLYTRYREEWQKTYDSLKKEYKVKIDEKNLAAFLNKEF